MFNFYFIYLSTRSFFSLLLIFSIGWMGLDNVVTRTIGAMWGFEQVFFFVLFFSTRIFFFLILSCTQYIYYSCTIFVEMKHLSLHNLLD